MICVLGTPDFGTKEVNALTNMTHELHCIKGLQRSLPSLSVEEAPCSSETGAHADSQQIPSFSTNMYSNAG